MSTTGTKPGGKKTGGRGRGRQNKKTVERINALSAQAARANRIGEKRAVEVLNDLMKTAVSFAALEQRKIMEYKDADGRVNPDAAPPQMRKNFWKAMECAGTFAKYLAPFQDPTFKAIAVNVAPTAPTSTDAIEPRTIEGQAVRLDDPIAVSRIYQQMVRAVR